MTGDAQNNAAEAPKARGRKKPAAKKNSKKPAKKPAAKKKPAIKKTPKAKKPARRRAPAAKKKPAVTAPGHDPLTGLADSELIRARARAAFAKAAQDGQAVTLAVLDLDDFREVNAVHDFACGDALLLALTEAFARGFPNAPIGRLAGDAFLLILVGVEPEEAFLELEKIRARWSAREHRLGAGKSRRSLKATLSIGLAGFPKDGRLDDQVLARALAALRRAKRLGKDRIGLPPDDAMTTKTSHYTRTQLDALRRLAKDQGRNDAGLLREALEDLLLKYKGRRGAPEENPKP